jgi:myo-inositol 2-dehydrogenase/D-chiro-inositol 1-dehydrogenase
MPWVKERQANWSDAEYLVRNWLNFTELSGDHIVEQHIHNLDVANWFIGRTPQAFLGYGARIRRVTGNQFDFFSCDIDYGDGVHIHSMCRQISGTYMKLGEFFRGAIEEPKLESPDSQVQEHVELIKGVLAGKPLNTIQEGADSTLTAIGARISAYTGQMVRWTDMTVNTKSPFYALQLAPTALDFEHDSVVMPSEAPALPGEPWPKKA